MNFKDVINKISIDSEYKKIARSITRGDLIYEDLLQEFILIIYNYDKRKIIGLERRNELRAFAAGVMYKMYNSNTSPFAIKYKHNIINDQITENEIKDNGEEERKIKIEKEVILRKINNALQYEFENNEHNVHLLMAYLNDSSYRKLSKKLGISKNTICAIINKTINNIKKNAI